MELDALRFQPAHGLLDRNSPELQPDGHRAFSPRRRFADAGCRPIVSPLPTSTDAQWSPKRYASFSPSTSV